MQVEEKLGWKWDGGIESRKSAGSLGPEIDFHFILVGEERDVTAQVCEVKRIGR